jgi:hypothetical protein
MPVSSLREKEARSHCTIQLRPEVSVASHRREQTPLRAWTKAQTSPAVRKARAVGVTVAAENLAVGVGDLADLPPHATIRITSRMGRRRFIALSSLAGNFTGDYTTRVNRSAGL